MGDAAAEGGERERGAAGVSEEIEDFGRGRCPCGGASQPVPMRRLLGEEPRVHRGGQLYLEPEPAMADHPRRRRWLVGAPLALANPPLEHRVRIRPLLARARGARQGAGIGPDRADRSPLLEPLLVAEVEQGVGVGRHPVRPG